MEFHVDILPLASPFSKHLSPIYLLIQTLPTVWFSSNSHFPFQLGGKGEVSSTGPTTHEERGLIIVEPGG